MNNPAPPSEELTIVNLKKLVNVLEKGESGVTPIVPSPVDLERASAGVTPKDTRARVQYRFWLDAMKDPEFEVAQEILLLKERRKFQTTIKNGLRLMIDLRAGRIDVLLELFPWVKDEVMKVVMR